MLNAPLYSQLDPTRSAECIESTAAYLATAGTIQDAAAVHNCTLLSGCPRHAECGARLRRLLSHFDDWRPDY